MWVNMVYRGWIRSRISRHRPKHMNRGGHGGTKAHGICVEVQRGKKWSAAKHADQSVRTILLESCKYLPKHADQSVRTGVLRHTSYTTYTLRNVPDLQGSSVAKAPYGNA